MTKKYGIHIKKEKNEMEKRILIDTITVTFFKLRFFKIKKSIKIEKTKKECKKPSIKTS